MFSGLQDILNNALKDIKEKAVQKTLQVGIEEEATAMKNIGEAENNFKIVKNIDEPIKNLQYDVYLKHLMIEYLEKLNFNQENNNNGFRIIKDVNQALNSIPSNRSKNLKNKKNDNSILIGIPVVLLHGTGGNTDLANSENFNFIICQGNCSENNLEMSFLNKYTDKNRLENYKANTTIKNIEDINNVLNTDKLFTNFEQTKLYENLVGEKSIFSDIGYHPNDKDDNDISYVYFRINFESSITCNDKIEHFDTPEYIHFILQKYNLTSKELDNKINKNKELILIEQNKYNIKAGIFKILKYISIILTILFIFIIGYYSIGKEKINEVIANVTKNNKISNKTNNKMNNRTNNKTNNSLKFIKK